MRKPQIPFAFLYSLRFGTQEKREKRQPNREVVAAKESKIIERNEIPNPPMHKIHTIARVSFQTSFAERNIKVFITMIQIKYNIVTSHL